VVDHLVQCSCPVTAGPARPVENKGEDIHFVSVK
jgi:hypothetical protein